MAVADVSPRNSPSARPGIAPTRNDSPCASAIAATIDRPRPRPTSRMRPTPRRRNGRSSLATSSGGTTGQVLTTTCGALTRAWLSSSGAVCRGGRRLSAWRIRDYFKSQPPRSRPPEIASRPPTLNVYGLRRFSRMLGHRSSYPARHKLLGCVRHFVASRPGPGRLDGDTRAGWSGTLAVGSHACRACARRSRVRRPATR